MAAVMNTRVQRAPCGVCRSQQRKKRKKFVVRGQVGVVVVDHRGRVDRGRGCAAIAAIAAGVCGHECEATTAADKGGAREQQRAVREKRGAGGNVVPAGGHGGVCLRAICFLV